VNDAQFEPADLVWGRQEATPGIISHVDALMQKERLARRTLVVYAFFRPQMKAMRAKVLCLRASAPRALNVTVPGVAGLPPHAEFSHGARERDSETRALARILKEFAAR